MVEKKILTPGEIFGIVIGVAAVAIAVLAFTPQEWSSRLTELRKELGADVVHYMLLISGFCFGILVHADDCFPSKR